MYAIPKKPDLIGTYYFGKTNSKGEVSIFEIKNAPGEIFAKIPGVDLLMKLIGKKESLPVGKRFLIFAHNASLYAWKDNVLAEEGKILEGKLVYKDVSPTFYTDVTFAVDILPDVFKAFTDSIGAWVAKMALPIEIVSTEKRARTVRIIYRIKAASPIGFAAAAIILIIILALAIILVVVSKWAFGELAKPIGLGAAVGIAGVGIAATLFGAAALKKKLKR